MSRGKSSPAVLREVSHTRQSMGTDCRRTLLLPHPDVRGNDLHGKQQSMTALEGSLLCGTHPLALQPRRSLTQYKHFSCARV